MKRFLYWGIRWYGSSKQRRIDQTSPIESLLLYHVIASNHWLRCILLSYWSILCGVFHHHPILYIVLCGGTGGWHDGDSQPQTVSLATVSAGPTYLTYYLVPPLATLSKTKKKVEMKTWNLKGSVWIVYQDITQVSQRAGSGFKQRSSLSHLWSWEDLPLPSAALHRAFLLKYLVFAKTNNDQRKLIASTIIFFWI